MKVKRLLFVSLLTTYYLLLTTSSVWAIFEERPSSARAWGMGGAFTAVADDSSAIYFNPAGLARLQNSELSFSYTQLNGMKTREHRMESFVQPLGRHGTLGLSENRYGHKRLIEDTYIFSYGRKFTLNKRDIYLGGNAKYLELEIKDLDKEFDWGGDIGLLTDFREGRVSLGFFAGNINVPHIGEDLPLRYAGGIAYRPSPDLTLAADYHCEQQEEEENDEFRLGLEYHWLKYLFFRSGLANNPGRWTVGLGLKNSLLSLDYAYLSHHNLDETHLATLALCFDIPDLVKRAREREPKKPPEILPEGIPEKAPVVKPLPPAKKRVNINTASLEELAALPGMDSEKAEAIINYRQTYGSFESLADLFYIPEINIRTFLKMENSITIPTPITRPPEVVKEIPEPETEVMVEEKRPLPPVKKRVNINTASRKELAALPGMNNKKAAAIIDYRQTYGSFKVIADLFYIPKMNTRTFLKIESLITVEEESVVKPEGR